MMTCLPGIPKFRRFNVSTSRRFDVSLCAVLLTLLGLVALPTRGAEIVYPVAGGTLADGGVFGDYDGVVDSANWVFGATGFSGAVTLTTETPDSAVEHRVVCEYDLRRVGIATPLKATLGFTIQGVSVSPFPDVTFHVYSYPADLMESPGDFSAGPAVLRGVFRVAAMQAPTAVTLDVTELVSSVMLTGDKMVAFRFQIDPDTPHVANQVFIEALDTEPGAKPLLTIRSAVAGDADDDGDVDLDDFAFFADCMAGPGAPPQPAMPGVIATDCLWVFDRDADADVDLGDLSSLFGSFLEQ